MSDLHSNNCQVTHHKPTNHTTTAAKTRYLAKEKEEDPEAREGEEGRRYVVVGVVGLAQRGGDADVVDLLPPRPVDVQVKVGDQRVPLQVRAVGKVL